MLRWIDRCCLLLSLTLCVVACCVLGGCGLLSFLLCVFYRICFNDVGVHCLVFVCLLVDFARCCCALLLIDRSRLVCVVSCLLWFVCSCL